jgi:hypothetical protein
LPEIVDGQGNARCSTVFGSGGLPQVGGERGDVTLARQGVADKTNAVDH